MTKCLKAIRRYVPRYRSVRSTSSLRAVKYGPWPVAPTDISSILSKFC